MKRPPKMRTPDHTRSNLGHNYSYTTYTCGEPHHRQNPNWKPFKLLWDYSERTGYDFFVVRDIIFERIGRKLVCECEMVRDDVKHRRMELEKMFGVDFGEPGRRGLELV